MKKIMSIIVSCAVVLSLFSLSACNIQTGSETINFAGSEYNTNVIEIEVKNENLRSIQVWKMKK